MLAEKTYGVHGVARKDDYLACITFGRDPTEREMEQIMDGFIEMMEDHPCLTLLDFTHVGMLPAGVRRVVGQKAPLLNLIAIASFGASFHVRVVVKLINGAIALFRKDDIPQEFFKDRESALAWLAAQKQRYLEEKRHAD